METRLYGVLGGVPAFEDSPSRVVTFFCMATDPHHALEQQQAEDDPELGGPFYGRADSKDVYEHTWNEYAPYDGRPMFPEGIWYATEDAQEAYAAWVAAKDTQTINMFEARCLGCGQVVDEDSVIQAPAREYHMDCPYDGTVIRAEEAV